VFFRGERDFSCGSGKPDTLASESTSIPSYWRVDAFVEAKIDKNWKLKLYVRADL
jgi:outer membrane receptor for monomeric catechols